MRIMLLTRSSDCPRIVCRRTSSSAGTPQPLAIVDNQGIEDQREVIAVRAAHLQAFAVEARFYGHRGRSGEKLADHGGGEPDAAGRLVHAARRPS